MFLRKLSLLGTALMLTAAEPPRPPAAPAPRADLYGDPLPKGALLRLGTIQCRTGSVDHLAVRPDGKSIVGLRRGTNRQGKNVAATYLSIWDAATGELRQTRELPEELGNYRALSADGRLLVTPDATLWNLLSGKPIRTFRLEEKTWLYCAVFSPDGKQVAGVLERGRENTVVVWDVASGKKTFAQKIDNQVFGSQLIFSPDGKRLLVPLTAHEGGMGCWDVPNGRLLWKNKALGSYSLVITPDGKILSAQPRGPVVDLATGRAIALPQMPPVGWSNRLTLTPDGRTLLVADGNGVQDVVVWDLATGKEVRRLERAGDLVVAAADGKSVVTSNGALQRWDLRTGKPLFPDTFARGHARDVVALAFTADGKRLASASTDGSVRLWDATTGRPHRVWAGHRGWNPLNDRGRWPLDWGTGAKAVDITPDGRYVLSGGGEECLRLWDATADKLIRSLAFPPREEGSPECYLYGLRISPDGVRAIAVFGSSHATFNFGIQITNTLAVWDLKTGEMLRSRVVGRNWATDSAISLDGRTVLMDGDLVDVTSGKKIGRLRGGQYGRSPAFSRDGALAVGSSIRMQEGGFNPDGVRVWETATGKVVAHLKTESEIYRVRFHPDNRFVAGNDKDGLRVWDARSGEVVAHLQKQELMRGSEPLHRYGSSFAFTPDGRRLATGHPDSTILLWDLPPPPSKPEPLAAKEFEALWTDLADDNAAKAWRAVWRLADAPNAALPLLRARLKAVSAVPADVLRKLVADLDEDSFQRRETAKKRLKELERQAEPALRAALQAKPSLEMKRRIEALLAALPEVPPSPSAEELRQLRALIVLERIGSPEARRLLKDVAKGPESARLTRQARAALACVR